MPITYRITTHRGAQRVAARLGRTVGLSRAIVRETRADNSIPTSIKRAVIAEAWKVERSSVLAFLSALRTFYVQEHLR